MAAIFTYECLACGDRWEETRDRNDPNLDIATDGCLYIGDAGRSGRRVFNPGNVQVVLKGSGWAAKDARAEADD